MKSPSLLRSRLLPLLLLLPFAAAPALAEDDSGSAPPSKPGLPKSLNPPVPTNPAAAEIARAIREARKELETLQSRTEKETAEAGSKAAEAAQSISSLREEELKLRERLGSIEEETRGVEGKIAAETAERERTAEALKAVEGEVEAQASAFRGRFEGSLSGSEDSRVLEAPAEALQKSRALQERVALLLEAYGKILTFARTVGVLPLKVALNDAGGRIENTFVLRMGLLGGYYSRTGKKEGGFIIRGAEGGAFLGESRGLDAARQASIAAIAQRPEKGGLLPLDVTGGAALAVLQAEETPVRRLERGGVFVWPILGLGAIAAVIILVRATFLAARGLGLQRKIDRALKLVAEGRLEAARAAVTKLPRPARAVFNGVFDSREEGRVAMEAALQEALLRSAPAFRGGLSFLATCSTLAPVIGFAGTLAGLLATFQMAGTLGLGDRRFLAVGLADSLIATEVGLLVAIPCLFFRGLLSSAGERCLERLEGGGLGMVIGLLRHREEAAEVEVEETV